MKKVFLFLFVMLLTVSAWGANDPSYLGAETILNRIYNSTSTSVETSGSRGSMTTHRDAVSSVDSVNPAIGSGVDCTGYRNAIIDFDSVKGTQWTITPIYGNATANAYMPGSALTVSGDSELLLDVYGSADVYIRLDSVTNGGSGTTLSVYVTPVN